MAEISNKAILAKGIETFAPGAKTSGGQVLIGMGGTGNLPVPVGYQPTGTSEALVGQADFELQMDVLSHSAGLVAQQDGQVARATPNWNAADALGLFWHLRRQSVAAGRRPALRADWMVA